MNGFHLHRHPAVLPVASAVALAMLLASCGGGDDADSADLASQASVDVALSDAEQAQLAALGVGSDTVRYVITLNSAAVEAATLRSASTQAAGGNGESAGLSRREAAVASLASRLVAGHGATQHQRYTHALQGFAASVPKARSVAFVEALSTDPAVERIEVDRPVSLSGSVQRTVGSGQWGLDRIDQAKLPLNSVYASARDGTGVRVYVIDTGVSAHDQFGSRLLSGWDGVGDGNGTADCNGHGSHVAGIAAGSTTGVAPGAEIVPMRALTCNGAGLGSTIISALDWILANGQRPAVVNLSLGGSAYAAQDEAVTRLASAGYTVVVAAGNDNRNACTYSPARVPAAITVGATGSNDTRASYSNFGSCLDLFAPGSSIEAPAHTGGSTLVYKSGTSMATPHAAGAAALLLEARPTLTPTQVATQMLKQAGTNLVKTAGSGSPNKLLYAGTAAPVTFAAAQDARVSAITSTVVAAKTTWTATVTTKVLNENGTPVKGAVVSAQFSNKSTVATCTTTAAGTCSLTSAALSKAVASVTYAVKTLSGSNITYVSSNNVLNSLSVARP